MIRDLQEAPILDRLASKFPKHIQLIRTDLRMQDAMREEAKSAGDPNDPAVRYRLAILDMAAAAGKKDIDSIYSHTHEAVDVAKELDNIELQATAFLSGGIHLFNLRKKEKALEYYNNATSLLSETAEQKPGSAQVASQVQAAKGALYFGGKRWKEALEAYQLMATYATISKAALLEMEGWRMAGFCAKKNNQYQEAFQYTKSAYAIGVQQNPESIPYTTLPHVGNQLIELSCLVAPDQAPIFENELKTLLGHDWQTQFRTLKAQA
jgi:tetratricopeptide (TPR) repeat protein